VDDACELKSESMSAESCHSSETEDNLNKQWSDSDDLDIPTNELIPCGQTTTKRRKKKVKLKEGGKKSKKMFKMDPLCSTLFSLSFLTMVSIASLNTNGLCNVEKMRKKIALCDERNYRIVALQETHWNDSLIEACTHLWNGEIIYNNSFDGTKGVAFFIRNNIKHLIKKVF